MTITQTPDQSQVMKVLMHYKKFYISLLIICICIVLFFVVIIPQLQQYGQQREEIAEVQDRIKILQDNITYLSQLNVEEQNTQLQSVLAGLPDDKDYAGILFAVRNASAKAGVGLGDFTFQVGQLSQKGIITKTLPTIALNLNVIGNPQEVGDFIKELSQTLPLSNITEVSMGDNASEILVDFYYKPVPQLQVNYTQPVGDLNPQAKKTVNTIQGWYTVQTNLDLPSESSASASPFGL